MLGKLELPTTGTKNEPQRRLRNNCSFRVLTLNPSSSKMKSNELHTPMIEKMQVLTEVESSRAQNQKLFADVQETPRAENQTTKTAKKLEATTEKLLELHKSVSKRITSVEENLSDLEKTEEGKLVMLEKINSANLNRTYRQDEITLL